MLGIGTEYHVFYRAVIDAIPAPLFVVDEDVRIIEYNVRAERLVGEDRTAVYKQRGGDVLHCIQSERTEGGCGSSPGCKDCIVRNSVRKTYATKDVLRRHATLDLVTADGSSSIDAMIVTAPVEYRDVQLVLLMIEDVGDIDRLREIIPICSSCKKVRDDKHYWQQVEEYVSSHTDIEFSHGLCPDCARKMIDELHLKKP